MREKQTSRTRNRASGYLRLLTLLAVLGLGTTGCLYHTHILEKPVRASVVVSASADQLIQQVNAQYDSIHSLSATVLIRASVGGAHKGKVTDYTSVRGFILLRKPEMLRVLGLLPVLETRAFDMASNGNKFTLLMPTKNKAVTGTETVAKPSENPLENLRPSVFLDSLLIRSIKPDELVYVTNNTRVFRDPRTKHLVEEPDYDLGVLRHKSGDGNELVPVRVVHISRSDLLPYQQDVYDDNGTLVTKATYSKYQTFGKIQFPTEITIVRPEDEYQIDLSIQKLTLNLPLADNQFQLKIPPGTAVKHLE